MYGFKTYFPINNKKIPDNIPYYIKKSISELKRIRNNIPKQIQKAQVIQKGDLVLILFPFIGIGICSKLGPKYRDPFKIIKTKNNTENIIKKTPFEILTFSSKL